ncbi:hypothetical protein HYQ46_006390 [Verticillium longisporum]|nr:hypothetical protein HYQ46_006390 [Verticillium longisporum]
MPAARASSIRSAKRASSRGPAPKACTTEMFRRHSPARDDAVPMAVDMRAVYLAKDLASVGPLVEKGRRLAHKGSEVANAKTLGKALADNAPGEDVDVDEAEGCNSDDGHEENLFVDLGRIGEGVGGLRFGGASSVVEVIDELTEENRHQGERSSGGGGTDGTPNDESNVEPCRQAVGEASRDLVGPPPKAAREPREASP